MRLWPKPCEMETFMWFMRKVVIITLSRLWRWLEAVVSNQPLAWRLLKWSWKISTSRQPWAVFLLSRILWLLELPAVRLAIKMLHPKDILSIFLYLPAISMFILDRDTASIDFLFALRTIYIFFSFLISPKTGPLAILDNDQLLEKPAHGFSGGKLDEQIMTKIEEALVWLGQCKTQAGKALVNEFKGSTAVFIRRTWKARRLSCSLCRARWKVSRSLELQISRKSRPNLPALANVLWFLQTKSIFFCFCPFFVFAFNFRLFQKIISICDGAAWSAKRSSVAWMPWAEYSI